MGRFWLSPEATADLDEIHTWISVASPRGADRVLEAACTTIRRLAVNPGLGHPRKFRRPGLIGLRAKQVERFPDYLIFYRPVENGIEVVRVLRGSRDLESLLPVEEGA